MNRQSDPAAIPVTHDRSPCAGKPPPEKLLLRAVEARAAGHSWEAVARLVQRTTKTLRRWPSRYPEEWDAALQAAQQQAVVQAGNEAVGILRRLISRKTSASATWPPGV